MTLRASWFSTDHPPSPVLRAPGAAVPAQRPLTWARWLTPTVAEPMPEAVQTAGLPELAALPPMVEPAVDDPAGLAELALAMERSVRALGEAHAAFLEQSVQSDRIVERMLAPWLEPVS